MITIEQTPASRLVTKLDELHINHWLAPLITWLSYYDGLEQLIDDDAPINQVLTILEKIPVNSTDEVIAQTLVSNLDFLYWRVKASFSGNKRWNPHEEPLYEFIKHRNEDEVNKDRFIPVWQWDHTWPDEEEIVKLLLHLVQSAQSNE